MAFEAVLKNDDEGTAIQQPPERRASADRGSPTSRDKQTRPVLALEAPQSNTAHGGSNAVNHVAGASGGA
jgi:hypothetical protein